MARILYGVAGEGMGHAVRSRVVLEHLTRSHEVVVVASGRAFDYLKARERQGLRVSRIWGLSIVYQDNAVENLRTFLSNVRGGLWGGVPRNVRAYFELARAFAPDAVISDFETWSGLFARTHGVPCLSLDNNHVVDRCRQPAELLAGKWPEYLVARALVRAKAPRCARYLISTFFRPAVSRPRTNLYPPVLRAEILAARPERGAHLLVYQTSTSNEALLPVLRSSRRECRIYGLRRDLVADHRSDNLLFRPFDEGTFVEDLRTARAVVSGGSFIFMSEAIYLHKPMLSFPVRKQFEQTLNARWLQALGYGVAAEAPTERALEAFEERLPELEGRLAGYAQQGNGEILAALDAALAEALGGPAVEDPLA
jgi:uncharacterized protein (TIGR00661 family)